MTKTSGTKEWACKNINFSKGCSNACKYCYARRMANRFGWKKWDDWANMENREEMGDKKFKKIKGVIMTPSSHDLTLENVSLAKKVLYNLLAAGNQLLIVSKPRLTVIRELVQHLYEFKDKNQILWRFTISTLNEKIQSYWEPGAPLISERIATLEELFDSGWQTSVSIEPFLDYDLVELVKMVEPFVSETIWIGPMNKIHVPKELWTDDLTGLYSPYNLYLLKKEIDSLKNFKIRYKDHFLGKSAKYINKELNEVKNLPFILENIDIKRKETALQR